MDFLTPPPAEPGPVAPTSARDPGCAGVAGKRVEPGGDAPWWADAKRRASTLAGREALLVLGAAAFVQLVMVYRSDLPSHVMAGGGTALLVGAAIPHALAARLGRWLEVALFVAVLPVATVAEGRLTGPFDLVDLAFTLGGALVALDGAVAAAHTSGQQRRLMLMTGAVLVAVGFGYRHYGPEGIL